MKLPLREAERNALRAELARWDGLASSALLRTESLRACRRYGTKFVVRAESALERIALLAIDEDVLAVAARLEPPELRSLDALHLASALSLGRSLGVLITYDRRLTDAALAHGVRAEGPA